MRITIRHTTRYTYQGDVTFTVQRLRLTPQSFEGQRVVDWSVTAPGADAPITFRDGFGNIAHLVSFPARHDEVVIEAGGTVETADMNGLVRGLSDPVPPRVFLRETPQTRPDAAIRALAAEVASNEPLAALHELSRIVRDRIDYEIGATHARTSATEALADGKGVCQDHAHVFIAAARTLAVPARYVTGYLYGAGHEEQAEAHHAWAEAYVERLGWVGFDVANRLCPTDRYVRLATGLDAGYAAPVRGSRRGGTGETLTVEVEVAQASSGQHQSQSQSQGDAGGSSQGQSQTQSQTQTNAAPPTEREAKQRTRGEGRRKTATPGGDQ